MRVELRRYGESALLAEVDARDVLTLTAVATSLPGVTAAIPGACTVLIETENPLVQLRQQLADLPSSSSVGMMSSGREHQLTVRYDGADLAEVGELCGLSTDEVIALHSDSVYTVAFCGFAPGFAYLTGLNERLRLPRLGSPRTDVPAGSVAIADEYTAVYPRSSPGGWRLIGHCAASLFDSRADPPALLAPGDQVRFICQ